MKNKKTKRFDIADVNQLLLMVGDAYPTNKYNDRTEDELKNDIRLLCTGYTSGIRNVLDAFIEQIVSLDGDVDYSTFKYRDRYSDDVDIFEVITGEGLLSHIYSAKQTTVFHNRTSPSNVSLLEYLVSIRKDGITLNKLDQLAGCSLSKQQKNESKDYSEYVGGYTSFVGNNENANIDKAFDNLIKFIDSQDRYTLDDVNYGILTSIASLFFGYYSVKRNEQAIFRLFECWHNVSNRKAHNYNDDVAEVNGNFAPETHRFRPVALYKPRCATYSKDDCHRCNDMYIYYYMRFYKQFENGKFYTPSIKYESIIALIKSLYTRYTDIVKTRKDMIPLYRDIFNELKTDDTYAFEMFEYMSSLIEIVTRTDRSGVLYDLIFSAYETLPESEKTNTEKSEIELEAIARERAASKLLDILEQNSSIIDMCLGLNKYVHHYNNITTYNIFRKLKISYLSEDKQTRYWRMLANYINNKTMLNKNLKSLINDLLSWKTENKFTIQDFMTNLSPYLDQSKAAILLELYME